MRQMKDSGYSWLGQIPALWPLKKGKYIFRQKSERGNSICLQLLSPTQNYGVIPQELYEEISGMSAVKLNDKIDLAGLKTVHKGAYVISLRSFQGGFEYSEYEGVVSPAYQVFYPSVPICDKYFKYMFKDRGFIEKMNSYTISLRDGKNIAFSDFGNTYIPLPSVPEQQRIAAFLDEKCAEIDALTTDVQKEIEILQEYRRSIISEAVTKGLDPDVEMKDSGISYIGKMPKTWKLSRLKFNLRCPMKYGASESGMDYDELLPRYIRITDITMDGKLRDDGKLSLSESQALGYILNDETVLFARSGATVGKTFLYKAEYGRSAFAGYLISSEADKSKMLSKWLMYYTNSWAYKAWTDSIFTQATIQNIGADRYCNMPIVIPSVIEQQSITNYLDSKCKGIDSIIETKQKQIETLSEYRKSLIYEYVTGKKEVI